MTRTPWDQLKYSIGTMSVAAFHEAARYGLLVGNRDTYEFNLWLADNWKTLDKSLAYLGIAKEYASYDELKEAVLCRTRR